MANILILHSESARRTGTVNDHLEAFKKYSAHVIVQIDSKSINSMNVDLNIFDFIVIHYSIQIINPAYLSETLSDKLKNFSGGIFLFIQDEMRWVNATCARARELKIGTIFTVVNKEVIREVYKDPWFNNVRFESTLTGFVPEDLIGRQVPAYVDRHIDVSYRARKLPAWLGTFGREKWSIAERFMLDAKRYGLNCDISCSEGDRIYGEEWINFLANSKATLGVESGSSFIDFTGKIAPKVEDFEERNPEVPFEEIVDRFLEGRDGEINIQVISPRCFEAAALRTLMVMYEGKYSGILVPYRHYIPLARDHNNMKYIVDVLRDPAKAAPIIEASYKEIACSNKWTYKTFIEQFDNVVNEESLKLPLLRPANINPKSVFELEQSSKKFAEWSIRRERLAYLLSNSARSLDVAVDRQLPGILKRPILGVIRFIIGYLKKLLSRVLIG